VTRWFYDRGWAGVNIEPIPELHARLERERRRDINILAAAGAAPGRARLRVVRRNLGYSSLRGEAPLPEDLAAETDSIEVEVVTLDSVLDRLDRPAVHFLKIDVEGAEAEVLAGLDLRRHRPWSCWSRPPHRGRRGMSPPHGGAGWRRRAIATPGSTD
jgi:FkbM family methyltransferase